MCFQVEHPSVISDGASSSNLTSAFHVACDSRGDVLIALTLANGQKLGAYLGSYEFGVYRDDLSGPCNRSLCPGEWWGVPLAEQDTHKEPFLFSSEGKWKQYKFPLNFDRRYGKSRAIRREVRGTTDSNQALQFGYNDLLVSSWGHVQASIGRSYACGSLDTAGETTAGGFDICENVYSCARQLAWPSTVDFWPGEEGVCNTADSAVPTRVGVQFSVDECKQWCMLEGDDCVAIVVSEIDSSRACRVFLASFSGRLLDGTHTPAGDSNYEFVCHRKREWGEPGDSYPPPNWPLSSYANYASCPDPFCVAVFDSGDPDDRTTSQGCALPAMPPPPPLHTDYRKASGLHVAQWGEFFSAGLLPGSAVSTAAACSADATCMGWTWK